MKSIQDNIYENKEAFFIPTSFLTSNYAGHNMGTEWRVQNQTALILKVSLKMLSY